MDRFKTLSVLCVDDDAEQLVEMADFLGLIFGRVYSATDPKEALGMHEDYRPDIVICDYQMPKMNGLDLLKAIRRYDKDTAIFITSAFTNDEIVIQGVDLGMTSWIKKPITPEALEAKLALIDSHFFGESDTRLSSTCSYEKERQLPIHNNTPIHLTHKERLLLALLVRNAHSVVSYEKIGMAVWENGFMSDEALRTTVKALRKKIPDISIKNHHSVGYKLETL